jgi:flagellar biosynthesis anti-sigma factor FlgM
MSSVNLNGTPETDLTRVAERAETNRVTDPSATLPSANASAPPPADTITVSEHAAKVRQLAAKIEELPEVRQERVEHLRKQVQSGAYHPSAEEIAEALIKDGLESGARSSKSEA